MTGSFTIGVLAKAAGVKASTIRFYETIGLLPSPPRTQKNYRRYGEEVVPRLRFIARTQALGFDLEDIRQLLTLFDRSSRGARKADAIAKRYIADIDRRLAEMKKAKTDFVRMIRQRAL